MLTGWNKVLLGELIIAQLIKRYSVLCGEARFINVFARTRQWIIS
jgi:hypothetical protein